VLFRVFFPVSFVLLFLHSTPVHHAACSSPALVLLTVLCCRVCSATWYRWLDDCRDWCISRQLWWGHRIPAYFVVIEGQPRGEDLDEANWVVGRSEEEALAIAAERFGVPASSITLEQDEDVLDTWFSSGLFPFSTLGWPDVESPDFKAFYPNQLLETGHDILFFWVARMVMMGLELTDQLPFTEVYLHAMVRDKYGRKMSKSLGNVIDPMEVIMGCTLEQLHEKLRNGNLPAKEVKKAIKAQKDDYPDGIPECGADALRFGLLAYTLQGRDVNLDINRVVGYRQFCNKLWNATRFALSHLSADKYTHTHHVADMAAHLASSEAALLPHDRWILSRLNAATTQANDAMKAYQFATVCSTLHHFWLHELCDVYLELIKPVLYESTDAEAQRMARWTLYVCLDFGLRLLHPMMPYVTEELWQHLPGRGMPHGDVPDPASIMLAPYPRPQPAWANAEVEGRLDGAMRIISAARHLRAAANISRKKKCEVFVRTTSAEMRAAAIELNADVCTLASGASLTVLEEGSEAPAGCAAEVVDATTSVHVQLRGMVDFAAESGKLKKRIAKLEKQVAGQARKLANEKFVSSAPERVVNAERTKLAKLEGEVAQLQATLETYAKLAAAE